MPTWVTYYENGLPEDNGNPGVRGRMGAWGYGAFENDVALDWVTQFRDDPACADLRRALTAATGSSCPEFDECSQAVCAAEIVAALKSKPARRLPDEVKSALQIIRGRQSGLATVARKAIQRVLRDSEMRELWRESQHFRAWQRRLRRLLARLEDVKGSDDARWRKSVRGG
jgi:hypothetical protein